MGIALTTSSWMRSNFVTLCNNEIQSSVQEARMQSERFFNERMLAAVADDWEAEKRRNVGDFGRGVSTPMTHMAQTPPSVARLGFQSTPSSHLVSSFNMSARKPASGGSRGFTPPPTRGTSMLSPTPPGSATAVAAGSLPVQADVMMLAYSAAVVELNDAILSSQVPQPCKLMLAALETRGCIPEAGSGGGQPQRATRRDVWRLLDSIAHAVGSIGPSAVRLNTITDAETEHAVLRMCAGARSYLEEHMSRMMQETIRSSNVRAELGGVPSDLKRVRAFLRVKIQRQFLGSGSGDAQRDTTWTQIYYCLRAGFVAEAIQVAQEGIEFGPGIVDTEFVHHLKEWNERGQLSAQHAMSAYMTADRILASEDRDEASAHKLMVHLILSGDKRQKERFQTEFAGFVRGMKFEDFFWFHLAMVKRVNRSGNDFVGVGSITPYALSDFQQSLRRNDPSYYTDGGRHPLLYVMALLMSMQFAEAIKFMDGGAGSAARLDIDAVHIAVALAAHGVATESMSSLEGLDGLKDLRATASGVIMMYARGLLHSDMPSRYGDLALDYFACAAMTADGGSQYQAFVEALMASPNPVSLIDDAAPPSVPMPSPVRAGTSSFGLNLTPTKMFQQQQQQQQQQRDAAPARMLSHFVANVGTRERIIQEAAEASLKQARYDEAAALFARANKHVKAIDILNRKIMAALFSGGAGAAMDDNAAPRPGLQSPLSFSAAKRSSNELTLESDLAYAKRLASFVRSGSSSSGGFGGGGGGGGGSVVSASDEGKLLALEQIEDIKGFLEALRSERFNEAVRLLCNLSFIPVDLGRVSTCAREIEKIDDCIRMKMSDILLAASEALQRAYAAAVAASNASGTTSHTMMMMSSSPMAAQSEHVRRLKERILAISAFASQASTLHLSPALYAQLTRENVLL